MIKQNGYLDLLYPIKIKWNVSGWLSGWLCKESGCVSIGVCDEMLEYTIVLYSYNYLIVLKV